MFINAIIAALMGKNKKVKKYEPVTPPVKKESSFKLFSTSAPQDDYYQHQSSVFSSSNNYTPMDDTPVSHHETHFGGGDLAAAVLQVHGIQVVVVLILQVAVVTIQVLHPILQVQIPVQVVAINKIENEKTNTPCYFQTNKERNLSGTVYLQLLRSTLSLVLFKITYLTVVSRVWVSCRLVGWLVRLSVR